MKVRDKDIKEIKKNKVRYGKKNIKNEKSDKRIIMEKKLILKSRNMGGEKKLYL